MPKTRSMSVSAFKQQCLKLFDERKLLEQPLTISRRGKPVAVVSAPGASEISKSLKGSVRILKAGWETASFEDEWSLK